MKPRPMRFLPLRPTALHTIMRHYLRVGRFANIICFSLYSFRGIWSKTTIYQFHSIPFPLQEELDLSAPNKSAMLSLPNEKKWQIYCSQKGPAEGGGGSALGTQPEPYIEKVNALAMVGTAGLTAEGAPTGFGPWNTADAPRKLQFPLKFEPLIQRGAIFSAIGADDEIDVNCRSKGGLISGELI